jgi:GT2 family glycosyltransferase
LGGPVDLTAVRMPATVIIPSWNGARLLPTCLTALQSQTRRDFETVVVDSGSSDDTDTVLGVFPEVQLVRLPTNRGFAAAVNAGIRVARGEVIVLLNNDTAAEPGWLEALLRDLLAAPDAGMATSKVRLFDRPEVLHTTGDTLNIAGWPANRGVWEVDRGQWDAAREVFGANAAAGAYRRTMLDDVGLFEEAFGSYLEDVDLAWRARLAGWRCIFVPEAVVLHRVSATGGGALASYLVARNRVWLIARNYPARLLRRHWRRVLGAQVGAARDACRAWRGREARATLRGLAVGWLTWPRMLPARRRIQSHRRLPDATLAALLEGEVPPFAPGHAPH